jgi:hypothetical protein
MTGARVSRSNSGFTGAGGLTGAALIQLIGFIGWFAAALWAAERDQNASDAPQHTVRDLSLNELGLSEPIVIEVPRDARSLTVVVVGDSRQLYALASLRTADGIEHIGWDEKESPARTLNNFFRREHICHFPGRLRQCPRLGTFTLVYPNRPEQKLPPGPTSLRVASEKPGGARLHVLFSGPNKTHHLHLNFITVSRRAAPFDTKHLAGKIQEIFEPAGIQIVVDHEIALNEPPYSELIKLVEPKQRPSGAPTDPEETPDGDPARLALLGHQRLPVSNALNVYLVDSFGGRGIKALSLGTPGPPLPSSYYFGVFVERSLNYEVMARLTAHEIAHFLGLDHPTRWSASDISYRDGLVPSAEVVTNLMGSGAELNEAQIFVMTRSPLLSPR